eukprot:163784-Ditylum_brightwellii.AAC.1
MADNSDDGEAGSPQLSVVVSGPMRCWQEGTADMVGAKAKDYLAMTDNTAYKKNAAISKTGDKKKAANSVTTNKKKAAKCECNFNMNEYVSSDNKPLKKNACVLMEKKAPASSPGGRK